MSLKLFQDCTDQELKAIYEQITWGKNMDLGHKLLTHTSRKPGNISVVFCGRMELYGKSVLEEVGKRFFESVPDEGPIPRRRTIYEGLKKQNLQRRWQKYCQIYGRATTALKKNKRKNV